MCRIYSCISRNISLGSTLGLEQSRQPAAANCHSPQNSSRAEGNRELQIKYTLETSFISLAMMVKYFGLPHPKYW